MEGGSKKFDYFVKNNLFGKIMIVVKLLRHSEVNTDY